MSMFSLCNKDHRDHGQKDHGCNEDHKCPCFHCAISIIKIIVRRNHIYNTDHKHPCFHSAIRIVEIIEAS